MHVTRIPLVTFIAAMAISAHAVAATPVPRVLDQAVKAGAKVTRQFPAGSGLTGWVLSHDGRHSIVYTSADNKTLIAGMLIDQDGNNLSRAHEQQYVPQPDFSAAYGRLEKSAFVMEGRAKDPVSVVYAFVDANCPFCHHLWRAVQPYEAAGLQVRWIPVATLGPTSMPKALAVLSAKDKTAAFRQMEAAHGKPWDGAARYSERSHPAIAAAIRANGELMEQFGIGGTPGVIWRDKQGKVHVKAGMPRLSELPAITGLPEQPITDPDLTRFR